MRPDVGVIKVLAALGQETRFSVMALLRDAHPDGMAAGAIAEAIGSSSSVMSFHLKELEQAGLIESTRVSRSNVYKSSGTALARCISALRRLDATDANGTQP